MVARGKCLSGRTVLHPLSNSDLAHTRWLSYINSRCQSLDMVGGTAMHPAVPVRFQMTLFTLLALLLPLSPSPMPPAAVTWVMHGPKDDTPSQLQCRVYDGVGCTIFCVLKMRFCAGYRHVRVIFVCGVHARKYDTLGLKGAWACNGCHM